VFCLVYIEDILDDSMTKKIISMIRSRDPARVAVLRERRGANRTPLAPTHAQQQQGYTHSPYYAQTGPQHATPYPRAPRASPSQRKRDYRSAQHSTPHSARAQPALHHRAQNRVRLRARGYIRPVRAHPFVFKVGGFRMGVCGWTLGAVPFRGSLGMRGLRRRVMGRS
jgi:hypothetical protein